MEKQDEKLTFTDINHFYSLDEWYYIFNSLDYQT